MKNFLSPGFATMLHESGARVPSYRRFMLLGDKTSIAKWANQNLGQQNPNSNVKAPSYGTFSSEDLNLQLEELILRWKNQLPTVGPGSLGCIPIIFRSRRMPLLSVAILLCGTASMFTGGVLVRIPALFGGMTFSFRSNKFSWTKSHRTSRFASILQEMLCVMPGVLTSTRMIHLEFDFDRPHMFVITCIYSPLLHLGLHWLQLQRKKKVLSVGWSYKNTFRNDLIVTTLRIWEYLHRCSSIDVYVGVSKNRGTPKSSIWIGFSIINHPFWGTPIFGNIHVCTVHFGFAWIIITLCPESLANCWQKCRNVSRLNDWVDHAPQKRSCFQVVVTRGKKVCIWSFPGLHHVLAQRRALRWFLGVGFFFEWTSVFADFWFVRCFKWKKTYNSDQPWIAALVMALVLPSCKSKRTPRMRKRSFKAGVG